MSMAIDIHQWSYSSMVIFINGHIQSHILYILYILYKSHIVSKVIFYQVIFYQVIFYQKSYFIKSHILSQGVFYYKSF